MKKIIKKICIEIAGVEVEVTPQQAKELHEALAGLLGIEAKETVVKHEYYPRWWYAGVSYPNYSPGTPIWYQGVTTTANYNATDNTATITVN